MTYDFVFVILVYRNTQDLKEFFTSLQIERCKVVVVNSYYDDNSENEFRKIATENGADFLSVPNKGYGYGNNRGCEHALNHYQFHYLIVSNADVEIKNLNINLLETDKSCISAPKILTRTGKNQNPFMPYYSPIVDKVKNLSFTQGNRIGILLLSALARLEREFYLKLVLPIFKCHRIYAAHGAFVIFPYEIIKKLTPLYNENMFLFAEEEHLAQLARRHSIPIIYKPLIHIKHKEDGSTSSLGDTFEYVRKSYMEYYRYWYLHNQPS